MSNIILSVSVIYFFIVVGYFLKAKFNEKIDDKTLTLVSIYGLQPIMTFWGIMLKPIDLNFFYAPLLYLSVTLFVMIFLVIIGKTFIKDIKIRSIFIVSPLIGNTGNLGIPLGIVLLGVDSAYYTNAINLSNVFFVYTFGVFFYSLGEFSLKESFFNIFKMPVIWVAIFAVTLNILNVKLNEPISQALLMGAYSAMVVQLLLFGVYLKTLKSYFENIKLSLSISFVRFLVLPFCGFLILTFVDLDPLVKGVVILELLVPLAVSNTTLSHLYNCRYEVVTAQVFITSIIFIFVACLFFYFGAEIIGFKLLV